MYFSVENSKNVKKFFKIIKVLDLLKKISLYKFSFSILKNILKVELLNIYIWKYTINYNLVNICQIKCNIYLKMLWECNYETCHVFEISYKTKLVNEHLQDRVA